MKFLLIFLIIIPIITASEEQKSEEPHEEVKGGEELRKDQALREIVKGNNEFSLNFFKHVTSVSSQSKHCPAENVVFSPLSISSAFSMLLLGSGSQTHQEILEGLSLSNTHCKEIEVHQAYSDLLQALKKPKSSLKVDIGNAIILDQRLTLLNSFKDGVQDHYHAEIMEEDFSHLKEVENKINEYVKNKTEGRIEELVKDLSEESKMVLVNYVTFNGKKGAMAA